MIRLRCWSQQQLEEALDVTKQKDMSGFYRHIYPQTMGEEKGQDGDTKKVEGEPEKLIKKAQSKPRNYRQNVKDAESSGSDTESDSQTSDKNERSEESDIEMSEKKAKED